MGRLQQHIYVINTSCRFFFLIQTNALFVFFKSYLFDFQHRKANAGEKEEETNYKYLINITSTNSASNSFLM